MPFVSSISRKTLILVPLALLGAAGPALARPGGYPGGPGWGGGWGGAGYPDGRSGNRGRSDNANEGKVEVSRFVAPDLAAGTLGHGAITVTSADAPFESRPYSPPTFEAAIVDQLVHAGYDTTATDPSGGQIVELRVIRREVQPKEAAHKPVSGEMTVGASNHGSMMGMAVNVDLTKPRAALVSTRMEARIRDRQTNQVLWEGRAEISTRDGDADWTEQAIAAKLAQALFDGFPNRSDGA
jgi:hypothetical protein